MSPKGSKGTPKGTKSDPKINENAPKGRYAKKGGGSGGLSFGFIFGPFFDQKGRLKIDAKIEAPKT